jgi:DNA-binding transcriptional ArsR family regulator
MFSSALQDLFGGRAAEAVLLHAFHYGETYGRAVSRDFEVSLESVQRQLDRFERAGAFISKRQGRTLVYSWNPKSRIASRLRDLVAVIHEGMSPRSKESLFSERRQPRRKDKPVIPAPEIEDAENVR